MSHTRVVSFNTLIGEHTCYACCRGLPHPGCEVLIRLNLALRVIRVQGP